MNEFPFASQILTVTFLIFAVATAGGALLAALATRIIRSVCGLALCCVGLAGLYYFLNSPFLALMEILIYVGAVCVTIIFGIMLAEPDEPIPGGFTQSSVLWATGALAAAAVLFWGTARLGVSGHWPKPPAMPGDGSVRAIGISLLTTYSLAFEVISVVLLVAIVGALALARLGRHHE